MKVFSSHPCEGFESKATVLPVANPLGTSNLHPVLDKNQSVYDHRPQLSWLGMVLFFFGAFSPGKISKQPPNGLFFFF